MAKTPRSPGSRLLLLGASLLLPLLLAEGLLAVLGWGGTRSDRYFRTVADHYSQPERYRWHLEHTVAREDPEAFRIAVLGASTVGGYPYGMRDSFATMLKHVLYKAFPDRAWEVLPWNYNGWASVHLRAMVDAGLYDALAKARPGLVIVYSGHNEFLSRIQMRASWASSPLAEAGLRALLSTRLYGALRCGLRGKPGAYLRPPAPVEGDVGGVASSLLENIDLARDSFEGLPLRDWEVDLHVARYRENLHAIVASCREAGVPVVLSAVAGGLADTEPMRSESARPLDAATRAAVRGLLDEAWDRLARARAAGPRGNVGAAGPDTGAAVERAGREAGSAVLDRADRALALAPGFAEALFLRGKALLLAGRPQDAGRAFREARDRDAAPIRATSRLLEVAREVAAEEHVPLFDAAAILASISPAASPGRDLIVDSVHPTWRGAGILGVRLADLLVREGLVPLPPALERRKASERSAYIREVASTLPKLPRDDDEASKFTIDAHYARVADACYAMLWANPGAARRILAEIPEDGPLEEWAYRRALVLRAILADHEGDGLALARARERILREFPSIRGKKVDPIVSRFLDIEAASSMPEIPGLPAVVTSPRRRPLRRGRAPKGRRP